MIDREYLELAAQAAGLRVGFEPDGKERGRYDLYWSNVHHQLVWHGKSVGSEYPRPIFWNPITNDADALRLAVKTGLAVSICAGYTAILDCKTREEHGDDPLAATRRAIVRAAAEIGKEMK